MAEITIVQTDSEIRSTFELMKQLRPHFAERSEGEYVETIKRMQLQYGYKLAVVFEEGQARSAAGFRITESLAWGRYLYVDDLITDSNTRSRGYAKLLFDWLEQQAKESGCGQLHLDSGAQRHDAHRFYLNRKMIIAAYHFQQSL